MPIRALRTFRWSCANWTRAPWRSRSKEDAVALLQPDQPHHLVRERLLRQLHLRAHLEVDHRDLGVRRHDDASSCHRGRSPFSTTLRDVYTRPRRDDVAGGASSRAPASRPRAPTRGRRATTALSDGTYAPRRTGSAARRCGRSGRPAATARASCGPRRPSAAKRAARERDADDAQLLRDLHRPRRAAAAVGLRNATRRGPPRSLAHRLGLEGVAAASRGGRGRCSAGC